MKGDRKPPSLAREMINLLTCIISRFMHSQTRMLSSSTYQILMVCFGKGVILRLKPAWMLFVLEASQIDQHQGIVPSFEEKQSKL